MKVTTDACVFGAYVSKAVLLIKHNDAYKKIDCDGAYISNPLALDIGTGTSLLAQMIAQENSFLIDAIEIDADAFSQAVENNLASPFGKRINILNGDARTFSYEKSYDLIVSNPPFYEQDLKSPNAQKNLAHHDEGLLLSELAGIINRQLTTDGMFFILLPYKRETEVIELFSELELITEKILRIRPTTASPFSRSIISGKRKSESNATISIEELAIQENGKYTNDATELLKPYYLFL